MQAGGLDIFEFDDKGIFYPGVLNRQGNQRQIGESLVQFLNEIKLLGLASSSIGKPVSITE